MKCALAGLVQETLHQPLPYCVNEGRESWREVGQLTSRRHFIGEDFMKGGMQTVSLKRGIGCSYLRRREKEPQLEGGKMGNLSQHSLGLEDRWEVRRGDENEEEVKGDHKAWVWGALDAILQSLDSTLEVKRSHGKVWCWNALQMICNVNRGFRWKVWRGYLRGSQTNWLGSYASKPPCRAVHRHGWLLVSPEEI